MKIKTVLAHFTICLFQKGTKKSMHNFIKQYCFCLLFCILFFPAAAQNAKQDILKINETYSSIKDLSMDITYTVFPSSKSKVALETHTGCFKQHGDMKYSRLKEVEAVHNNNYSLVIDNEDKLIVVANPAKSNMSEITMIDLDKSLSQCASIDFLGTIGSLSGYKLMFKQNVVSEYDAVELYFNKKSFFVEKLVIYYRQKVKLNEEDPNAVKDKPRLEIVFSNTNLKTIADITLFSEERFIEKKKGKYYPTSAYNSYQLIDQKFAK